jgi:glycosyltransferase involved in cell wall biosynthesis
MKKILSVATAGLRSDQLSDINHQCFPRVDYVELQKLINVDTLDYSEYRSKISGEVFRRLETQIRSDVYLATLGWLKSKRYPLVFTWSERAGIPFAFYKQYLQLNSRFINMFQCWSDRQEKVITKLGLLSAMNEIIVHCTSMKHKLMELGASEEQIHVIPYSIDQAFYSPLHKIEQQKDLIVSVGEPRTRDYDSLLKAVEGLSCNLKIAASGHWYAREKNNQIHSRMPDNVSILRYIPQVDLRKFYARAQLVVIPIHDLVYSAGATTTLEASAMSKPVIAFRSRGISDYIIDGETGILVEPGNYMAMREAIQSLLSDPSEARRLGQNARQRIEDELNLETYVSKIANLISQTNNNNQ